MRPTIPLRILFSLLAVGVQSLHLGCSDSSGSSAGSSDGGLPTGTSPSGSDPFIVEPEPPKPVLSQTVLFTPNAGTFVGERDVTLSTQGGNAVIRYTLDGSVPNQGSTQYSGPIHLTETALIRAVSFPNDGQPGDNAASVYVALSSEMANFSSNLPLVILERHGEQPIDAGSGDFRTTSLLVLEPGGSGRTQLLGDGTFMSRAGVHVRGETSRWFPQKGMSVELWHAGDDEDRDESVLGMPSESDWLLLAPSEMDRSLMRTMLPMDLSRRIGSYAPRMRYVEAFLVDREGSHQLEAEDYIGVYEFAEKIKRNENRVDVAKAELPADGANSSGGFIFRIDHGETDFNAGGRDFQWVYPDPEDMDTEERRPQVDFLKGYLDEFFQSIRERDFREPNTGKHYSEYIDVPQFIDHNLLVALTKNVDGLRLSAYFHKDKDGKVAAGPIWDFDRAMGTLQDDRAIEPEEWGRGDGTQPLSEVFWGDLFQDPEFEAAYWQRWDELAATTFSVESITEMIDAYEDELSEARQRHFEHWEFETHEGPAGEVQILRDWFARRIPWISSQRP